MADIQKLNVNNTTYDISTTWAKVTGKPSTFPPSSHTHDDRYYTESEVTNLLAGKANSSHGTHLSGSAALYSNSSSGSNCNNVTYNFSGTSFTSGDSNTGEHDANNITTNGLWYYTSNGPVGASTADGALYSQAYSTSWVGQIAQDYRNGNLFTRGRNNGTWTDWKTVSYTGHTHKGSEVTLTGYSKVSSYSEISASDTVNQAIAKLEYVLSGLEDLLASI